MITYQAINLTNKKFQVGSTTDFPRRCKEHHKGKGDLEFQRSLRKNPENFYWIASEDDGLDSRDEEQYYLDFYCGSTWCYNHNPSALAPPSPKGRTQSEETKAKISRKNTGNKRPDLAERNRNRDQKGEKSPMYGKPREDLRQRNLTNNPSKGKHWYLKLDGSEEKLADKCPGDDWKRGRKPNGGNTR